MGSEQPEPAQLKNLGPKTRQWLNEVGIYTLDDLRQVGALEAWRRIKRLYPTRVSVNALYGLEGALTNRHWNDIPEAYKAELRELAKTW
jgi:DNA transformation protein